MGESDEAPRAVIAVVASAGGVGALRSLVRDLPPDLDAAVLVVLHIPPRGPSVLPDILDRAGPLPARHPRDGERLRRGTVLVAPPDRHLAVADGSVRLDAGPRQDGHRPSGDLLLASVASRYGARAAGLVLSGTMDDGAVGLRALRAAGGLAMVQDPSEAAFPGMPMAAIEEADPQVVAPMGELVKRLLEWLSSLGPAGEADTAGEVDKDDDMATELAGDPPEELSPFTCPDCGGTLWLHDIEGIPRFRCRVGHGFSPENLWAGKNDAAEAALWAAVVALSERADIADRIADRLARRSHRRRVERYRADALEARRHAEALRALLPEILSRLVTEEADDEPA